MKFTVLRNNLLHGLQIVSKAVNTRSPLPVLSNVLIKTEKGRIKLTTSNLHVTISTWIGAKIDDQGEFTVPAKLLLEFVSQLTDEKIDFELEGAVLNVTTEKSNAHFSGIVASEFPEILTIEDGEKIELDSDEFSKALQKIQFVVATDESKPELTGVYVELEDDNLVLAGTDGFRMAEYTMKLDKPVKNKVSCILPAKSLADIVKTFSGEVKGEESDEKGSGKKISLLINDDRNIAVVSIDDMTAYVRMIEAQYPDYKTIVPDEFTTEVKISKDELASGVKLANIFAKDKGNMIKIVVNDGVVEILSQPTESGSNSTKLQGEVEGDDLSIAFNARYLLEFFNNVEGDEVLFKASESVKPGWFQILGKDNYFYLVMPMKANW